MAEQRLLRCRIFLLLPLLVILCPEEPRANFAGPGHASHSSQRLVHRSPDAGSPHCATVASGRSRTTLRALPPSTADLLAASRSMLRNVAAVTCALMIASATPIQEHLQVSAPAFAEEVLNAEEKQTVSLFERNTPGVVYITSEVFEVSNAARMEIEAVPRGSGSGWVLDDQGHILTNYHVIQNANSLTVKFIEGTEVQARVVGADPGSDVAVLQVQLPKGQQSLLKPLSRGSSAGLRVGQDVYAIGNPFGLDHTLTKGIVSGVGRTIMSIGGRPIQGAIQTDASINPGNSGGPLLNSQGQVIGMNTLIISPSGASAGVGFAIPSDTVAARANSILKYGYVKRPSLGLYLGQDGLAKRFSGREGGIVAGMQRNSAAGKAGLQVGDILLQINGHKVQRVNDIFAELDEHEPGESVEVRILRPDQPGFLGSDTDVVKFSEETVKVTLEEAPVKT